MITKAPHPAGYLPASGLSPVLTAYLEWNQLKLLYRQGWLQRGLDPATTESVAEHTLGVAMLAMWLTETHAPDLDPSKVLRMALIHDLGEAFAGDLTPADGVEAGDKLARERAGARRILHKLPNGETYLALWEEYEAGTSGEARLVRQLDRLEMALQAVIYEHAAGRDLSEFLDSAEKVLAHSALAPLLHELRTARPDA